MPAGISRRVRFDFLTCSSDSDRTVAPAGATVLSLSDEQVKKSKRTRLEIPAGTYAGQSSAITTTSLPVVAFTTTDMDNATAYAMTKTYWESKVSMSAGAKWWAHHFAPALIDTLLSQ